MGALDHIVRSGRALYVGISSYNSEQTRAAVKILADLGTPCVIHQPSYNIFDRWIERDGLKELLPQLGVGCIPFLPLAQGVLTTKYLGGIPTDSRAAVGHFLKSSSITEEVLTKVRALNALAQGRGQTLPQMALAWVLRNGGTTSALIGASRPSQVVDCVGALDNLSFTTEELAEIDRISL
jgi:L-glyceraldehyde 3-phosphate reductase